MSVCDVLAVTAAVWLSGCGGEVGDDRRDRTPAPDWTAQVRIMADSATGPFDRIGQVLPAPGARVVLTLPWAHRFLVYREDGRLAAAFGRKGSGPGEIQGMGPVGLLGDTLWVYDPGTRRITRFGLDGRLISTDPFDPQIPGWDFATGTRRREGAKDTGTRRREGAKDLVGLLSNGSVLVQGHHSPSSLATRSSPARVPVALVTRSGRFLRSLGELDFEGSLLDATGPTGGILGMQPFVAVPLLAIASDGQRFAIVRPGADGGAAVDAVVHRPNGDTAFAGSYRLGGERLSRARVDSALRRLGPGLTAAKAKLTRPTYVPAVSDARFGPDGSLWLRLDDPHFGREVIRWAVLDPAGRLRDTVRLPARFQLQAIETAGLWVVETDSLGVPSVSRVIPSEGPT